MTDGAASAGRSLPFIKWQYSAEAKKLLRNPNANHLHMVIASRANYRDERNAAGLGYGQAFIGDHESYGLTRQEDRTARKHLERMGLVRFEPSRNGTIATILDSRVWSLSDERTPPKDQPRPNHQPNRHPNRATNHQFSEEKTQNPTTMTTAQSPQPPQKSTSNSEYRITDSISIPASIYEAFPRKVARNAAMKAIAAALRTCPADELLAKTKAYAAAVALWPEDQRQYIPYPATWFNDGRYEDDPATWQRKGAPAHQSAFSNAF